MFISSSARKLPAHVAECRGEVFECDARTARMRQVNLATAA